MRPIHTWTGGRLLQCRWRYRLIELADDVYSLEVQLSDDTYVPATGHFEARRVASTLIEEDRAQVRDEIEAYIEDELREERKRKLLVGEFGDERKEA